jgi:hypothetical protein
VTHRRREVWVGWPTVKAILANKVAPGLIDRYLARTGYDLQLTHTLVSEEFEDNLFAPGEGHATSHGRFDATARPYSWQLWTDRHAQGLAAVGMLPGAVGLAAVLRGLLPRRCALRLRQP